jgi:hypothetical protein
MSPTVTGGRRTSELCDACRSLRLRTWAPDFLLKKHFSSANRSKTYVKRERTNDSTVTSESPTNPGGPLKLAQNSPILGGLCNDSGATRATGRTLDESSHAA